MPSYEFRCECGHAFELVRPIAKYPKSADCPSCGRTTRKRVYSISTSRHDPSEQRAVGETRGRATVRTSGASLQNVQIGYVGPGVSGATAINVGDGSVEFDGVEIFRTAKGVSIDKGGELRSKRLRLRDNIVGIDNAGTFDGPDTTFE